MMNNIVLAIKNNVASITLNRPDVRHAFNEIMIQALLRALNSIAADPKVRVLVLRSEGPVFCAGADLTWMQKMLHYSESENKADATQLAQLMHTLYTLDKPTIALVQGHAYGGGVGLVACCDIAIASPEAHFCFSEVKLGLTPSVISPYIIRAIGLRQAQRYFLTAESFNAKIALSLGLIHTVVDDDNALNATVDMLIDQLLKNGPKALSQTKQLLQQNAPLSAELIAYTIAHIAQIRASAEGQEGITAFLNHTPAAWLKY